MDLTRLRTDMVEQQIIRRGISDPRVVESMRRVPRHEFVLPQDKAKAYEDGPLSIGEGQTISQPYIVALMTQNLKLNQKKTVLEIGTGSGYQTAVLAENSGWVVSVERIPALAERARKILEKLSYTNVEILVGDASLALTQEQSFDAIIMTAASPQRPDYLFDRLNSDGRLVVPIGNRETQMLTLFIKSREKIEEKKLCSCVFVPLIGQYGWN